MIKSDHKKRNGIGRRVTSEKSPSFTPLSVDQRNSPRSRKIRSPRLGWSGANMRFFLFWTPINSLCYRALAPRLVSTYVVGFPGGMSGLDVVGSVAACGGGAGICKNLYPCKVSVWIIVLNISPRISPSVRFYFLLLIAPDYKTKGFRLKNDEICLRKGTA